METLNITALDIKNNLKAKWEQKEKDIIIKNVKKYPTNLQHAFQESCKELPNRNLKTITQMWYTKIRKDINVNAMTTGSEKGFTQNVKNIKRNEDITLPNQGLKHYMYILKELLNLSPKERRVILEVFALDI